MCRVPEIFSIACYTPINLQLKGLCVHINQEKYEEADVSSTAEWNVQLQRDQTSDQKRHRGWADVLFTWKQMNECSTGSAVRIL